MKKSVYQIAQEGANLAMQLAYLEGLGDDADVNDVANVMTQFAEFSADLPSKILCLHGAEDRLRAEIGTLNEQSAIIKRHIKAAENGIDRIKGLRIKLFHANIELVGGTGRKVKLPDGSSAWLGQRECHPKAVVARRHWHLLPAEVKVEVMEERVDKDLLLEWSETGEPVYDQNGAPVVHIEWVDPTHTRRK